MPSKQEHLNQADKNERFYGLCDLDNSEFLDWAVTALFYSVLHYVDAFLAEQLNYHPLDHQHRTPSVAKLDQLNPIHREYMRLKDESEKARYKIKHFTPSSVRQLERDRFQTAKNHLQALFRP